MRLISCTIARSSVFHCTAVAALLGIPGPGVLEAWSQVPAPTGCAPARSAIRIEATRVGGAISYVVTNTSAEALQWIRVGEGGGIVVELAPDRTPVIVSAPTGWRGKVVRQAGSDRLALSWEATTEDVRLARGAHVELGIRTRTNPIVREGRPALDLGSMPFSAGNASGACWWGRTTSSWEPPEGGYASGTQAVTVRPIESGGKTYVIVDAPSFESRLRLTRGRRPVFLTIPVALSWGTAGGFSSEASIGIGLAWQPSPYLSVSAQSRFGTFFFNNRSHLRNVGVDVSIPIGHATFSDVVTRRDKFLVIGAEYFDRNVVRWRGFLEGSQWYASGRGVAIRVGVRELSWSY